MYCEIGSGTSISLAIGFIGVVVGAFCTYYLERKLYKDKEIRHHQATLVKTQIILANLINEIINLRSAYNESGSQSLDPPIFITNTDWRLGKDLVLDLYFKGTKREQKIIGDCSYFDKQFRGLIGSIEDKVKYYEKYEIDKFNVGKSDPPKHIQQHMTNLTKSIQCRLSKIEPEVLFKQVKGYTEFLYPGISIDIEVSGENKNTYL